MTARLPVRPSLHEHEDIGAYLERCADANHITFTELTGHQRQRRIWENPPEDLLADLAYRTGAQTARLQRATISDVFPNVALGYARTGRRAAGQPTTCPTCGVCTVAARLNIVVLCPRCDTLLADRQDPTPLPVPTAILTVQAEVLAAVAAAQTSKTARDRVQRLEALMVGQEPALRLNWPRLLPGETSQWRERVVLFERQAIEPGALIARPPSVTATLMALTWPASCYPETTERDLDDFALRSETRRFEPEGLPSWRTLVQARVGLGLLLTQLRIRFEHIPTTLRLPQEPVVLPDYLRTVRTAHALALATVLLQGRRRHQMRIRDVAHEQGHTVTRRIERLACRILGDDYSLRQLAAHAQRLHAEGLTDLHTLRCELRHVRAIPKPIIASLPEPAANLSDAQRLAAAWVWLDATQGRTAGGPYPNHFGRELVTFHEALNPEGRLILRQWWQTRVAQVTTESTAHRKLTHAARRSA